MHAWFWVLWGATLAIVCGAFAGELSSSFPAVDRYGGIVATPDAAEPPRRGAKIIFDSLANRSPCPST